MQKINVQYLVGFLLLGLALYQISLPDWWEFALYFSAGSAFLVIGLIRNNVFPEHEKFLNVLSWVLILLAGFLLLFLIRVDG